MFRISSGGRFQARTSQPTSAPPEAAAPERLSGRDVASTCEAQRRRQLIERIGVEGFLASVGGVVIDRDVTRGCELVRVAFADDEPLVAVVARCPCTGEPCALRVPPHIRSCREAAEWVANRDSEPYRPA